MSWTGNPESKGKLKGTGRNAVKRNSERNGNRKMRDCGDKNAEERRQGRADNTDDEKRYKTRRA